MSRKDSETWGTQLRKLDPTLFAKNAKMVGQARSFRISKKQIPPLVLASATNGSE